MDRVATLPVTERVELFQETATRRGLAIDIIEKDFWVCWTLKHLFDLEQIADHLIFKGGTSLSKVFSAIERFSEDIDLSIDRDYLGFGGNHDPGRTQGSNARRRQLEALKRACHEWIEQQLLTSLRNSFVHVLGSEEEDKHAGWSLIQDSDPRNLLFAYPRKAVEPVNSYIKPIVKIELGARSDHWPASKHSIEPYAAQEFPNYFDEPRAIIKSLAAERTFWEKATLLHAEYHRADDSDAPERISRHYYDLHRLARMQIGEDALNSLDLLDAVVTHKKVFFQSARANYDEANTGRIHLVPNGARLPSLRADYAKMKDMFFAEAPSFDDVVETMSKLENEINSRASARRAGG